MRIERLEKYKRELQDKIEVLGGAADQKLLLEYHKLVAVKSKEELLEKARKVKMAEVTIKEAPFQIILNRNNHCITFREATFVNYLFTLREQLNELHNLDRFRGFFLVFPDPRFMDFPEKYEKIPFSYLIVPGEQSDLFGNRWVKLTRIYRAHMTDKKPDSILTLNILDELEKPFERYLENAYLSRFGYNKMFYRPTYPYVHW